MTQTVLSSNGSLCVAQHDYKKKYISFKKGELLQLSNNGLEVQLLETGHKGIIPIGCVGYSKLELLQLFQLMTEQEVNLPHPVLQKIRDNLDDNDDKASLFLQSIDDDPTLLVTLRRGILKQYCK